VAKRGGSGGAHLLGVYLDNGGALGQLSRRSTKLRQSSSPKFDANAQNAFNIHM
jgi:hypothetical protein